MLRFDAPHHHPAPTSGCLYHPDHPTSSLHSERLTMSRALRQLQRAHPLAARLMHSYLAKCSGHHSPVRTLPHTYECYTRGVQYIIASEVAQPLPAHTHPAQTSAQTRGHLHCYTTFLSRGTLG